MSVPPAVAGEYRIGESVLVWEERWHPLREEWVIVAAHRQNRPWIGETVPTKEQTLFEYLPDCYFCRGTGRFRGRHTPFYTKIFFFENDPPCVGPEAQLEIESATGIYRNRPATGIARVVCYSPKHNLSLAELEV